MTEPVEDLRRIWSTLLATEIHDLDVNFFDAGGHSLLVMVLQEHLEELAGREIVIEDLFEHSTIRSQAELIAGPSGVPADVPVDAGLGARDRSRLLGRARTSGGDRV